MAVASDPAPGSVIDKEPSPPFTITGSSRRFCSSVPNSISGLLKWKLVAQMPPVEAHALLISRKHARYAT